AEQAAFDQLVQLGYLPPLPADQREQVHRVQIERLRALAQVYLGADRPQDAAARLMELRELAPDDRGGAPLLAVARISEGRFAEREALFKRQLEASPQDAALLVAMGALRTAQERGPEAIACLEAARAAGGQDGEVLLSLAALHVQARRFDEAIAVADQALA